MSKLGLIKVAPVRASHLEVAEEVSSWLGGYAALLKQTR